MPVIFLSYLSKSLKLGSILFAVLFTGCSKHSHHLGALIEVFTVNLVYPRPEVLHWRYSVWEVFLQRTWLHLIESKR